MQRQSLSDRFSLGSKLPAFKLKNVDLSVVDSEKLEFKRALLVVFGCNHCPYVQGSELMLLEVAKRFSAEGLFTLMINSNDPSKYPEDSFEKMQEKQLTIPYLFDESQDVARAFDAQCTPECYLFNNKRELVYHGGINDSHKDKSKVTKRYLESAVEQLLSAGKILEPINFSVGCSIKWRG